MSEQSTTTHPTFTACPGTYGGFVVMEASTIDGCRYVVQVSATYGTQAEAQAEADRRNLEAQS